MKDFFTLEPAAYSLTDDPLLFTDKPYQAAAPEIVRTPKEVLTPKPTPSAQSPEVQRESAAPTEASYQEMSVAGTIEKPTLPPNLTEAQG